MTRTPVAARALLVDWGGVLTTSMDEANARWLERDRISAEQYEAAVGDWISQAYGGTAGTANPIHALETGELPAAEFERLLAARLRTLDGGPVTAEGLLHRLFSGLRPVQPVYEVVRRVRATGVRTCFLSNSWGGDHPCGPWADVFDVVVISGQVGMRKPEERIFRLALDRLGVAPGECVFVDDLEPNVRAARALGLTGLHHRDSESTVQALGELFRLPSLTPRTTTSRNSSRTADPAP